MNKVQVVVICIIVSIIYVILIEIIKKYNLKKVIEENKGNLNSKDATNFKIRKTYEYETGNMYKEIQNNQGLLFEYKVFEELYKFEGKVLSDLFIPRDSDVDSQVDIVFVHNTGIYVIEAKKRNAKLIKGNDEDKIWQVYYSDNIKPINSPLQQNKGHLMALKNFLDKNENLESLNLSYKSIIVLNLPKNKIKVDYKCYDEGINQVVLSIDDIKQWMKNDIREKSEKPGEYLLKDRQVLEIYNYIHENCSDVEPLRKIKHKVKYGY